VGVVQSSSTAAGDANLDRVWDVERTGGLLPPLVGIRKTIAVGYGRTMVGPLPGPSFDVDGVDLRYRAPFVGVMGTLTPAGSPAPASACARTGV
jgi:hypothetical protein